MKRRVLGSVILVARLIGFALLALGAMSLVEMRFLSGNSAGRVGIVAALALGFAGIVWLVAVQVFVHFFDLFLSRN